MGPDRQSTSGVAPIEDSWGNGPGLKKQAKILQSPNHWQLMTTSCISLPSPDDPGAPDSESKAASCQVSTFCCGRKRVVAPLQFWQIMFWAALTHTTRIFPQEGNGPLTGSTPPDVTATPKSESEAASCQVSNFSYGQRRVVALFRFWQIIIFGQLLLTQLAYFSEREWSSHRCGGGYHSDHIRRHEVPSQKR